MIHQLKIDPTHLENKRKGVKMFEIRDNSDRGFQKGDYVEYRPFKYGCYQDLETDSRLRTLILYVTNFEQKKNYVVFGEQINENTNS